MKANLRSLFRPLLAWTALLAAVHPELRAQTPAALSPDRVTFFTEPNFKGDSLVVEAGASVENLDRLKRENGRPWTFAISSVKIEGAAKAIVHSDAGFRGDRLEITRDISDLYGEARQQAGSTWDRSIASVSVAGPQRIAPIGPAVQPAPTTVVVVPPPPQVIREVRPALSRWEADMIINQAYREVLNRPADPEGLRRYRDRVMHEGWSQRQVIQQLQRSDEARGINADEAITRIYREVLGRDPDANGLAHYRAKWRDGWTQGQILADLRRSNEGRDTYIRNTITRAYREVLGREPDPQGYAAYERLMREKGFTEKQLRDALMSGDEYRQRRNRGR